MKHELKILPQYFKEVVNGNKTFEIRKNDRGFKVGDTLLLREYQEDGALYGSKEDNSEVEFDIGYTGQEITKEVSYILEGGQYGLEEGYCILGLKQEGIQLKNINLTGIDIEEQRRKVVEEENEFMDAFFNYTISKTEENKIHVIDELLDEFQSKLGLIQLEGIKANEVQNYYSTWVNKLDKRPRIKECKKCINKSDCYLWHSEHWDGEKEAESCRTYIEKEEKNE